MKLVPQLLSHRVVETVMCVAWVLWGGGRHDHNAAAVGLQSWLSTFHGLGAMAVVEGDSLAYKKPQPSLYLAGSEST